MSVQALTQYFTQYGAIFVFVIVLLEYLNLPGFPARAPLQSHSRLRTAGGGHTSRRPCPGRFEF